MTAKDDPMIRQWIRGALYHTDYGLAKVVTVDARGIGLIKIKCPSPLGIENGYSKGDRFLAEPAKWTNPNAWKIVH